ncbi:MAG: PDZ domain-containing protein [Planctomycetes bacterium]|nr:PDZ domain-containing protein [Planctomycetota bacterium]
MKALTIFATKTGLIILTATSSLDAHTQGIHGQLANHNPDSETLVVAANDLLDQAYAVRELQLEDGTPALRRALGHANETGALVHRLDASSSLAMRGLRAGDLVVAVDGRPIDSAATARERLLVNAHDSPRVTVVRGGERFDLDV